MVVAAPAIGALAAFAVLLFLVMLSYAYSLTLGALLQALANFFKSIGFSLGWFGRISLAFIGDGIDTIDNTIYNAIGQGIIHTRGVALYLWHYLAYVLHEIGGSIADLAESTERALTHALHVTVPTFVTNRLGWLTAHVAALETTVAHLPARVERITVEKVHTVSRTIVHDAAVVGRTITLPNIRPLEREITGLEKWVKAHANALTVSGVIGLVAATVFKRLDLGWLKCRGVNRVGKSLCGLSGLIETLFSDAIEALVVSDLCQVVSAMSWAAKQFEPVLIGFVDVEDALIGCRGATKPELLNVPALSLPPVTGYVIA